MSKVFISYRRDDSAGYAHAIHSRLLQHFSKDQVFMDVDTMEPGVNFVRAIEQAVGKCDVLVALIGKRWAGSEPGGTSRFDNTKDYVRLEVSTALARDIRVIPVLVDGMTMPNEDSLPPPVQPITQRNAIEISNTRFNYDVDQLITAVRKVLDATEAKRKDEEERRRSEEERNQAEQEAERRRLEAEAQRKVEEERLREEERKRSEEEAKRRAEEENRIEEERNRAQQEAEQRRLAAEARRKADEENRRRIEEAANRAPLREEDTQETAPDRPEHFRRPDRRQLYAGGAVISVILIAVIASVIMTDKKEEPAPRPPPPPIVYEQQKSTALGERSDLSTERQAPESAKSPERVRTTSSTSVFRDRLKSGGEGPEMVVIPAGSFRMGDLQGGGTKDELPVHTVKFQKPFAIGRYEVTFEEYDQFANATRLKLPSDAGFEGKSFGRGRRPVMNISWQDAVEYTKWLSGQTGKRYRLPSEAEWEYAARGGKETAYWWGRDWVKGMANFHLYRRQTVPVGSFKPNPFGLYDTAGNVSEWVEDCWHDDYNGAPTDGSTWKETDGGNCNSRVLRGGNWRYDPLVLTASSRDRYDAETDTAGFRVARDLD
jgi:formylglycine-generating enzyme required for sulfatase activity